MQKTEFCERFDLSYPMVQAPMAGVTTPLLAAEVRKAGALPSLGCGAMSPEVLEKNIVEYMDLVSESESPLININFFSHQVEMVDEAANAAWLKELSPLFKRFEAQTPDTLNVIYHSLLTVDERVEILLAKQPQIVSFHFGLPSEKVLDKLKAAGVAIFASACHLDEAKLLEAAGVDYIVAQGYEAGGHRGIFDPMMDKELGTLELLKLLKKECYTPIIAAGGLMDGHDIRLMLEHGAEAVQLGTAFVLCPESAASKEYREQLRVHAKTNSETLVSADISGRPARGLKTKLTDLGIRLREVEQLKRPAYPVLYDANKQLNEVALRQGDDGYGAYWSGTGLSRIREMPAQELIKQLVTEAAD